MPSLSRKSPQVRKGLARAGGKDNKPVRTVQRGIGGMRRDAFETAVAAGMLAFGVLAGPSMPVRAADDVAGVLDLLFDAPHRGRDSLADMPAIAPVEAPFAAALAAAVRGDLAMARQQAAAVGYAVIEKTEDGRRYLVLMERDRAGIGPTVAIARDPVRDAVIQAPHPVVDRVTGRQAAVLFKALGARALVIAGAERCAATTASTCSGRTGVCGGGRSPYRTSDPAHNPATLFHVAHRHFARQWPTSVVVQPHGFSNPDSDVWFVISDGTTDKRPGDTMLTGRVRDALRASLGRDRAVSCQDPADRDIETRWLCATTNVQGRDLNGSGEICRDRAPRPSGRFLHIEQTYREVRKGFADGGENLSEGSAAILSALSQALPCIEAGCTPVK